MGWPGWERFNPFGRHVEEVPVGTVPRLNRIAPPGTWPRPHKYGAEPREVDGHLFPSKHEADRYRELRLLEQAGEISGLRLQVWFPLVVDEITIGHYVADFVYDRRDGRTIVEDAKGVRTDLYRWKRRHFEVQYGREIAEV